MNREEVIEVLTNALDGLGTAWIVDEAISSAIELLAEDNNVPTKHPDPITGLVPCEYCTDHKNLYDDKYTDVEMLDDFIHVDVRTQYEGWSFGFYINYCPMCGRKLTAPPRPGAIVPDAGEMAPNGDEGAEL